MSKKYLDVDKIRYTQRKRKLTTQELAECVEVSVDAWYKMLNFTQRLPAKKVKALCVLLGLNEDEIYENNKY